MQCLNRHTGFQPVRVTLFREAARFARIARHARAGGHVSRWKLSRAILALNTCP
jgi:hypothetical protein